MTSGTTRRNHAWTKPDRKDRWPIQRILPGLIAVLLTAVLALGALPTPAVAAPVLPPGAIGYDISFPQCKSGFPAAVPGQHIVGVNGGKAFTRNPCFADQFRWGSVNGQVPAFYMNLNYPNGATANQGNYGPRGACAATDAACLAYNYGHNAAQYAHQTSREVYSGNGVWWLDVETANYWSKNPALNAEVIQGALSYFQARGIAVGIYSIAPMWKTIAGSYAPRVPLWVAQTRKTIQPIEHCASTFAFGGGWITMVQSFNGVFDVNFPCAGFTGGNGTAEAPVPLVDRYEGTLVGSRGGASAFFVIGAPDAEREQSVTFTFNPGGNDVTNGLFVTIYQNGTEITRARGTDTSTPGTLTMNYTPRAGQPITIQLISYNDSSVTPLRYTITRS